MSYMIATETTAYTLGRASDDDYDFIYGVARLTMHDYVDQIWGWDEAFQSHRFRELFKAPEWELVWVDGQLAGCVNVQYRDVEIFLANIYLVPAYQGRGIGSSIIGRLQQVGRDTGRPVRLNVLTTNEKAYRLYRRLGFEVEEESSEKRLMCSRP